MLGDVKELPIGGADSEMPTPFQAGYQLACEEIDHRLRTEQWELCGTLAPMETKTPNNGFGVTRRMGKQ